MNAQTPIRSGPHSQRAAPARFTAAQYLRMLDAGVFDDGVVRGIDIAVARQDVDQTGFARPGDIVMAVLGSAAAITIGL
jgi:hypothetical protein